MKGIPQITFKLILTEGIIKLLKLICSCYLQYPWDIWFLKRNWFPAKIGVGFVLLDGYEIKNQFIQPFWVYNSLNMTMTFKNIWLEIHLTWTISTPELWHKDLKHIFSSGFGFFSPKRSDGIKRVYSAIWYCVLLLLQALSYFIKVYKRRNLITL